MYGAYDGHASAEKLIKFAAARMFILPVVPPPGVQAKRVRRDSQSTLEADSA